jgi:carbamoylphosphate synthase small subunit
MQHGITVEDLESNQMFAEGLICKDLTIEADNHRSKKNLVDFLKEQRARTE